MFGDMPDESPYAGFWRRWLAFMLDLVLFGVVTFGLGMADDALFSGEFGFASPVILETEIFREVTERDPETGADIDVTVSREVRQYGWGDTAVWRVIERRWQNRDERGFLSTETDTAREMLSASGRTEGRFDSAGDLILLALFVFYWLGAELSPLRATPGKALLGLTLTDKNGEKPSLVQTVIRNLIKWISLPFWLPFIVIGLTRHKQGLHDMAAGTYVVKRRALAG
ncbi:RDD family protein [Aestuariispira insulae]|nr:RDD family protein [Aestuariispira insulae]